MQKILITTGGTGGHTVPAQIINEYLNDDYEVYYSTDKRGYKFLSSGNKRTVIINTPRFNFSLNLPYRIIKLFYLIVKSFFYLKNENIKKVISIGGYMSLPVIISAKILRLPIFLIEPNLVLGKGNKFFLNFAKKIFCYSNEILNFPKKYIYKIELINPLVSKAFYNLKKKDDISNKFCFLIFGGSQGAKIFDEIIREIMLEISRNFSIKVIQQTSKNNIELSEVSDEGNFLEALGNGASEGMKLALNIAAMLIAFLSVIALLNWLLSLIPFGNTILTIELILGYCFMPLAFLMGAPWSEAHILGSLMGQKLVLTEFIAYGNLAAVSNEISVRTATIGAYALCGFANFASIGIQLGGIGAIAPDRKKDLAETVTKAMLGGALASWITACIAGILI